MPEEHRVVIINIHPFLRKTNKILQLRQSLRERVLFEFGENCLIEYRQEDGFDQAMTSRRARLRKEFSRVLSKRGVFAIPNFGQVEYHFYIFWRKKK